MEEDRLLHPLRPRLLPRPRFRGLRFSACRPYSVLYVVAVAVGGGPKIIAVAATDHALLVFGRWTWFGASPVCLPRGTVELAAAATIYPGVEPT